MIDGIPSVTVISRWTGLPCCSRSRTDAPLAPSEFGTLQPGWDRRSEQPRHDAVGARGSGNRALLREPPRDRAECGAFLDDYVVRPGFGPAGPPQDIDQNQGGEDKSRRAGQKQPPHTAFMIRLALVPLKPKLLFSTARTGRLRLMGNEIALRAFARIIEVQRRRNDLVAHRQDAEDALDRARAAEQGCPIADLVELIDSEPIALPNSSSHRAELELSPSGVEVPWALI